MKKEVEAYRTTLDIDIIFDGKTSLSQVVEALSNTYNGLFDYTSNISNVGVVNCRFETKSSGYDGAVDVELIFYRMESDEEYNKRVLIEKEKEAKFEKKRLDKEKKERDEYERLKKKFGEM